jgi:quinol monooxygenase YgiN
MTSKFVLGCRAAAIALTFGAPALAQAQAAAGDVTVLTIIDVVPDYAMPRNVENSAALLSKLAADTQHAPGLVSFKILRDATRPNHFVIDSVWKDMNSFAGYSGAETTRTFRQAFQPGQGGPFDERIYVDLK